MVLNLKDPDFFQNPYPHYARLRASRAPFWLAHEQDTTSSGVWLFSRHVDAVALFKKAAGVSKNIRSVRPPGTSTAFDRHLLHTDGADHLRLRRLVSDYFAPQYLSTIEARIGEISDTLVRALKGKAHIDLITDFAEQLPLRVIAGLVGVPQDDMTRVRAWSIALGDGFDSILLTPEIAKRQRTALLEFLDYIRQLIEHKKRHMDTSLLGYVVGRENEGQLDYDELIAMVGFLLFAGHETTIDLIGNGLWLLMSHPEQWQALQRDSRLLPGAVEEVLRYESPEQRTSFRITTEPTEINGLVVEPGQQVGVIIGSANRDEEIFTDPDTFNIRRDAQRHVAFGVGLHNCLGKNLARLEARIAFDRIIKSMPHLGFSKSKPVWRRNSFFRGLASLPVEPG